MFRCSDPEGQWKADLEADYEAQAADKADADRDLQNAETDRDDAELAQAEWIAFRAMQR